MNKMPKKRKGKIKYEYAHDIQEKFKEIVESLGLSYIMLDSVSCYRSYGSRSRRTVARCHTLGKLMQQALGRKGFYVLEFISERFDKLDDKEKTKIIIHELMHIPKSFGGGFRYHDYVCEKNIESLYKKFVDKSKNLEISKFNIL